MSRPDTSPRGEALTRLLVPYADVALPPGSRLVDVPPAVAASVLQHLPPDLRDTRLYGPAAHGLADVVPDSGPDTPLARGR